MRIFLGIVLALFVATAQGQNASKRLQQLEQQMTGTATAADITSAITTHSAASNPHPVYLTQAEGAALFQGLDSDLTTWGGLTPSAFFQTLINDADAATARGTLGLGTIAVESPSGTPDGTKFLRDDFSWQTASGAGGVDTANSPNANEFARFTDADTIEGRTVSEAKTDLSLNNVDNTSDAGKPVSTETQTALDLKAPLAGPTFTGTVTIPTPFTLGAVSVLPTGTELNHVDGVTSAIQTQLDAKLASASYTAADVLSKLLTVDGAASGVDADLLDGSSSAAFGASNLDYLVGTATGGLSAEIVVGTSPGGELGGTWASPTLDDTVTVDAWVMGASTATTPAANDSDTSLATTAFVQSEIDDVDLLSDNCVLENDATPIPDSCVGDGTDAGGAGGGISYAEAVAANMAGY